MKYNRWGYAEGNCEQLHGGSGGGPSTCLHGVEISSPDGLPPGFYDCPACAHKKALADHVDRLRRAAQAGVTKAATGELAANPPTKAELAKYLAIKQTEALRFVSRDDPEYPTKITWELIGTAAEEFLAVCRALHPEGR